jgi:hypothetical protein
MSTPEIGPDESGQDLSLVGINRPGRVLDLRALLRSNAWGDTCFRLGKEPQPGRAALTRLARTPRARAGKAPELPCGARA